MARPIRDQQNEKSYGDLIDPYGDLIDPYGDLVDPYGDLADRYGDLVDPYGDLFDPYGDLVEPHGDLVEPHGDLVDPYGDLIDPYGDLVDPDGDPIDPYGDLVDPDGDPIDRYGDLVDPDGDLVDPDGDLGDRDGECPLYPGHDMRLGWIALMTVSIETGCSAPRAPERLRLESLRYASRFSIAPKATADDVAPVTVTVTKEQLEKLIVARIAKAAASSATPTVGDGQTDVKAAFGGDFSWMPGNAGSSTRPLTFGPFTGELRVDAAYHYDFSNPRDHTISGSSEAFRSNEIQLTQLGFGGDFLYKNVQARLMTQFGLYSQTTPRNDASSAQGQWNLDNAYRYLSEAYAGYHIPVMNGVNVQAGLFLSYVGMWSYYNFDNWTYQPSFVSQDTPWYFDGLRVQIFPSEHLKIEGWLVNGWESYGKFNQAPGVGLQVQWRPTEWLAVVANQYVGTDTLGVPDRKRIHTDDSIAARWYHKPGAAFSQGAVSLTMDAGCEFGDGNAAAGLGTTNCSNQYFLGFMSYVRMWFFGSRLGVSAGGGAITNPGRYLVLVPPINGATGFSGVTATLPDDPAKYGVGAGKDAFSTNVGDPFQAWDMQLTADYMPNEFITFRVEFNHRAASIPYFAGSGGMTPCINGVCSNQGAAGTWPGQNGAPTVAGLDNATGPDLSFTEDRVTVAMMMKF